MTERLCDFCKGRNDCSAVADLLEAGKLEGEAKSGKARYTLVSVLTGPQRNCILHDAVLSDARAMLKEGPSNS